MDLERARRMADDQTSQGAMVHMLHRADEQARKDRETIRLQRELLLRAYQSGHREGWEDSPSVAEVMEELHNYLENTGGLK